MQYIPDVLSDLSLSITLLIYNTYFKLLFFEYIYVPIVYTSGTFYNKIIKKILFPY